MILYFIYVQEINTKLITSIYHTLTADCTRLQSEFDCVMTERREGGGGRGEGEKFPGK